MLTKLTEKEYAEAEFTIKAITEIIAATDTAHEADTVAYAGF